MPLLDDHRSRGVRALILLHDQQLRGFVATWRQARAADLTLPSTEDPAYASLDALAWHVLACARGYMVWCCEVLELPDPRIDACPAAEQLDTEAETFLEHVLGRWATSLTDVSDQQLNTTRASRWGVDYCVDAMLEHAVMHPARHGFQLGELLIVTGGG